MVVPTEGRDLRPLDEESVLETCEIEGIRLMRLLVALTLPVRLTVLVRRQCLLGRKEPFYLYEA